MFFHDLCADHKSCSLFCSGLWNMSVSVSLFTSHPLELSALTGLYVCLCITLKPPSEFCLSCSLSNRALNHGIKVCMSFCFSHIH